MFAAHTEVDMVYNAQNPIDLVCCMYREQLPDMPDDVQKLIDQPEYTKLDSDEKLALLEHGICPTRKFLPGCVDKTLNFAVEWPLLEAAMNTAFTNLRGRHSTVLDGTDGV